MVARRAAFRHSTPIALVKAIGLLSVPDWMAKTLVERTTPRSIVRHGAIAVRVARFGIVFGWISRAWLDLLTE